MNSHAELISELRSKSGGHKLAKSDLGHVDTLLIDCTNGARKGALAGSLLGLLDTDLSDRFVAEFNNIGFEDVTAAFSTEKADGIECARFQVLDDGVAETFSSYHEEGHAHHSRSLSDVSYIIDELEIDGKAATDAIGIYQLLAEAEAAAHDTFPGSVHFHEVGNDFAIASIVAFCMLMNRIRPKRVLATPVTTGFGFVNCAHGRIAIPAPATANVLNGLPTKVGNVEGELATPTGAAIIAYFASEFIDVAEATKLLENAGALAVGSGIDNKRFEAISTIAQMA